MVGGVTSTVKVPVPIVPPEVPFKVTVVAPALAVAPAVIVVVPLVPGADAVTPIGSPESTTLTAPVKPPLGVTLIVNALLLRRMSFSGLGVPDNAKDGPTTVNVIEAVLEGAGWHGALVHTLASSVCAPRPPNC